MYCYNTRGTLLLVAARKNALKDAPSFALHAQNFATATEKNVELKFTNRLIWTLHKICKYKGFLRVNYIQFSRIWTESEGMLVCKTILILIKFPFQRHISCRHLNFDPTYENVHNCDFPPFWKFEASWPFWG